MDAPISAPNLRLSYVASTPPLPFHSIKVAAFILLINSGLLVLVCLRVSNRVGNVLLSQWDQGLRELSFGVRDQGFVVGSSP